MQKKSWIVLGICVLLVTVLSCAYKLSQTGPTTFTREQATQMISRMQDAVTHKDVQTIMDYVAPSPDTRIADANPDQLRMLLARAFRSSDTLVADVAGESFRGGGEEATVEFNLSIRHTATDMNSEDYKGHITMHLKQVEVPHLLGLLQTKEWRITGVETTGPNLSAFDD